MSCNLFQRLFPRLPYRHYIRFPRAPLRELCRLAQCVSYLSRYPLNTLLGGLRLLVSLTVFPHGHVAVFWPRLAATRRPQEQVRTRSPRGRPCLRDVTCLLEPRDPRAGIPGGRSPSERRGRSPGCARAESLRSTCRARSRRTAVGTIEFSRSEEHTSEL